MNKKLRPVCKRIFIISLTGCLFVLTNYMYAKEIEGSNDQAEQIRSKASDAALLHRIDAIVRQHVNNSTSTINGSDASKTLVTIQSLLNTANNNLTPIQTTVNNIHNNLTPILPQLGTAISTLGTASANLSTATTMLQGSDTNATLTGVLSATSATTSNTAALATDVANFAAVRSAQLTAIKGVGFNAGTDNLHAISGNIANSVAALTTVAADFENLGTATDTSGLYSSLSSLQSSVDTMASDSMDNFAVLSADISALGSPTSAQVAAIEGVGFVAGVDDLHSISNSIATLATVADVANLGTSMDVSGIYASLSSLQVALALIISQQSINPVAQVSIVGNNIALTTPVVNPDVAGSSLQLSAYTTALSFAQAAITVALAPVSQSRSATSAAINALATATTDFNALVSQWQADGFVGPVASPSAAAISAALSQLNASLQYLLSFQQ